jgi:hypothetical protein
MTNLAKSPFFAPRPAGATMKNIEQYAIVPATDHPVTRIASEFKKDSTDLLEVTAAIHTVNTAVQTAIALKEGTTETGRASGTVGLLLRRVDVVVDEAVKASFVVNLEESIGLLPGRHAEALHLAGNKCPPSKSNVVKCKGFGTFKCLLADAAAKNNVNSAVQTAIALKLGATEIGRAFDTGVELSDSLRPF